MRAFLLSAAAGVSLAMAAGPAQASPATTVLVSVSSSGQQTNGSSVDPSVSADGRYVAFGSDADNLVPGDDNQEGDVFVRDLATGSTSLVSVSTSGRKGNSYSSGPAISDNGRYMCFDSYSSNLVRGDTNDEPDAFVRDRQTGKTMRVSVSSTGAQANEGAGFCSISGNGRYVAFASTSNNLAPGDTNGLTDIFLRDRLTGTTSLVSRTSTGGIGNGYSFFAAISADGRHVAFRSSASNMVPGDTNGTPDVFVRDLASGTTSRVDVSSSGAQNNRSTRNERSSISADGRYVAFAAGGTNLVPGDTNGKSDVFVRDRVTGTTSRVSVSSSGAQSNGDSDSAVISADGRHVAYESDATGLVAGGSPATTNIFMRDRGTQTTSLVTVSSTGLPAEKYSISRMPAVNANGSVIAFSSEAENLVPGDANDWDDIFVRDRG